MITTSSVLTLSLAKVFGAYMIAGGLSHFMQRNLWADLLENFRAQPGVTFLAGIVTFTIGSTIVMAHNIWTDPLAGFISLVGWVALIEGLIIIAWPKPLIAFSKSLMKPAFINAFAVLTILGGVVLVAMGFLGQAGL
ncbi:MAG: hypothetical protein HKN14_01815 [Marinicaulis sp.]|nr:hypothetical protein [Marinicaulis sp.]